MFALFCFTYEALPWNRSLKKIDKHINYLFDVISSGFFKTHMSSNTAISGCSAKLFAIGVRYVISLAIDIILWYAEINNINLIACFVGVTDTEIIGLDISMDYAYCMHLLNNTEHLECYLQDSLFIKLLFATWM